MRKAQRKRKETGNDKYFSELEVEDVDIRTRLENVLGRPFKVLFLEPMLIAITMYISVSDDPNAVRVTTRVADLFL